MIPVTTHTIQIWGEAYRLLFPALRMCLTDENWWILWKSHIYLWFKQGFTFKGAWDDWSSQGPGTLLAEAVECVQSDEQNDNWTTNLEIRLPTFADAAEDIKSLPWETVWNMANANLTVHSPDLPTGHNDSSQGQVEY